MRGDRDDTTSAEPHVEGPDTDQLLAATLFAPRFEYAWTGRFRRSRILLARLHSKLGRRIGDALFERGLETSSHQVEVDHFHPDRIWYVPSGWTYLSRVLRHSDVGPDDVFVDFGSGKGRVLCQAARYPFRRVVGVEISEALNEVARQNVERNRHRFACADVEVVTTDAVSWDIPDDMTVAYFCSPFVGDTFRRVIDNIVASLVRRPRRLRIVYALPMVEDAILATQRFRVAKSARILYAGIPHRVVLYDTDGA